MVKVFCRDSLSSVREVEGELDVNKRAKMRCKSPSALI